MNRQSPLLRVRDLTLHYSLGSVWSIRPRRVKVLDRVSFELDHGETVGLVGESGSGKTSLARCLLGLVEPSDGEMAFDGADLLNLTNRQRRAIRPQMQGVFQDPNASINPRKTVLQVVGDPARVRRVPKGEVAFDVQHLLDQVGLGSVHLRDYPGELSLGQKQRVAIARALILRPSLLICDEPVSALDVSIQAQILNLLSVLQAELGLALLLISHDLAVVRHVAKRTLVMYFGQIVEAGPTEALFSHPRHPYSRMLLFAAGVPSTDAGGRADSRNLWTEPPSRMDPPSGCPFHPRCAEARSECKTHAPPSKTPGPDHFYRCVL